MIFSERKKLRQECLTNGLQDPVKAYGTHRANAKKRGIDFLISFDEWWEVWSSYYHLRGVGTNGLCMARCGDVGAYAAGNVYLTTNLGNMLDYFRSEPAAKANLGLRLRKAARPNVAVWSKKNRELCLVFEPPGRNRSTEGVDELQ